MAGNQVQVILSEMQNLINATHSSQQDQHSARTAYTQRGSDRNQSGLAGTVRNAATSVGNEGAGHWQQTAAGNQRLVDNGTRGLRAYSDGQDNAHSAMSRASYSLGTVINP